MSGGERHYHLEGDFPTFFQFLNEGKVGISYSPIFREFSIPLREGHAKQSMHFCPWSGKAFPPPLRSRFFEILENEFGFTEPTLDDIIQDRVPHEMQSEAWWIRRGL